MYIKIPSILREYYIENLHPLSKPKNKQSLHLLRPKTKILWALYKSGVFQLFKTARFTTESVG